MVEGQRKERWIDELNLGERIGQAGPMDVCIEFDVRIDGLMHEHRFEARQRSPHGRQTLQTIKGPTTIDVAVCSNHDLGADLAETVQHTVDAEIRRGRNKCGA